VFDKISLHFNEMEAPITSLVLFYAETNRIQLKITPESIQQEEQLIEAV
jgi:hypothetical protein